MAWEGPTFWSEILSAFWTAVRLIELIERGETGVRPYRKIDRINLIMIRRRTGRGSRDLS